MIGVLGKVKDICRMNMHVSFNQIYHAVIQSVICILFLSCRLYGHLVSTYESASTRRFLLVCILFFYFDWLYECRDWKIDLHCLTVNRVELIAFVLPVLKRWNGQRQCVRVKVQIYHWKVIEKMMESMEPTERLNLKSTA